MNNNVNDKIEKYERLAAKNPKYYVSIGDLYADDGAFKAAPIYYQKAVDNGVLAYAVLGDTWGYRNQYKKAFDVYAEGANKGEVEKLKNGGKNEDNYSKRARQNFGKTRFNNRFYGD